MAESAKFVKNVRSEVATASVLTVADDVGAYAKKLGDLVNKCEHHLDGLKSLVKRMKQKIQDYTKY